MNGRIVPSRAAETHLENHRYWWTKSKETQSEGLRWELKVGRFKEKKKRIKSEKCKEVMFTRMRNGWCKQC